MELEEIKLWRDAWQLYANLKTEINELNEIGNKLQELTGNGNDFQFMNINSPEEESDDDDLYIIQMLDGDGDTCWLREDDNGYNYYVHSDSSIKVADYKDVASIYNKRNAVKVLDATIYQLKRENRRDIAITVEAVKLNK